MARPGGNTSNRVFKMRAEWDTALISGEVITIYVLVGLTLQIKSFFIVFTWRKFRVSPSLDFAVCTQILDREKIPIRDFFAPSRGQIE